jgi:phenylpropionate dioxygenase-like ring-hydroxylating dioxygenase large terminal subunit
MMMSEPRLTPPETRGHFSVARVLDAWYPACRSQELADAPEPRTLLGSPIVLYRDAEGRAGALLDRCPHRNVRLSLGAVDDNGHLACAYHGWRFDRAGACREVPGLLGPSDPAGRAVPSFATCEQDGFLGVCGRSDAEPVGEPLRVPHVDDPDYLVIHREYDFECTLHAALENALDVPHTAFVHRGDFRGKGRSEIEAVRRRIPDGIEVEYLGEPPLSGPSHDDAGRPIVQGHWDRFLMPSTAQVEYQTGETRHLVTTVLHTPVSDTVTHAFFVSCWRIPEGGEEMRPRLEGYLDTILPQDVAILREQTETLRRFGGEAYRSTELDLMGPEIWRMLRQAERGLDPNAAEIDCRVRLSA